MTGIKNIPASPRAEREEPDQPEPEIHAPLTITVYLPKARKPLLFTADGRALVRKVGFI